MNNLKIAASFQEIEDRVKNLMRTENSYMLLGKNIAEPVRVAVKKENIPHFKDYSPYGLSAMASRVGYPAQGLSILSATNNEDLADEIIGRFTNKYLEKHNAYIREFGGLIYGFLSERYSTFDDDQVLDIIKTNDYLTNADKIWYDVSPVRFHARFIDKERFTVGEDNSPLSMAVFVDNSMVGASCFKIRFGIYRHACTNGMIWGLKEFTILKERHLGDKDWTKIVAKAINESEEIKELIRKRILFMQGKKSAIYGLDEDKALAYIKNKLVTSEKTARKILDFYNNTYGGQSKWDLCNAITEASQELSLENRLTFETKALMVA